MAFSSLDTIRTAKLNVDLGLDDDDDDRFGTTAVRNTALQDAFGRLWPTMARLTRETLTPVVDTYDYTLSTIRDLITIEIRNSDGDVLKEERNWRTWVDEAADPVVVRLLKPRAYSDLTVVPTAVGYAPYAVPTSSPPSSSGDCDLEPRLEWIVVYGARSYLYRRRFNQFIDYERRQNQDIDNAISPAEFFQMYQDSERQFQDAIQQHQRSLVLGRSARLRR